LRYDQGVDRANRERLRARLEAARRQWLPAGQARIVALQMTVDRSPTIVVGVEAAFAELILTMRADLAALLDELDRRDRE
jgi:hypothetical protein